MFRIWDPFQTMENVERDINRLFTRTPSTGYPPINVYSNENDVLVTSEIPGIDPKEIDLNIAGNTLTLKGERKPLALKNGDTWHRRERGYGQFLRTVRLPYNVDTGKVEANYEKGILKIALTRAEADKPRKINVRTAE